MNSNCMRTDNSVYILLNCWKRLKQTNKQKKHLSSLNESFSDRTDPGGDFMAML